VALTQLKTAAIADDAVTGAKIADDTVAEANIANDAIGLTELKAGTDGQIITYDASGNPTAVGPGTDGQVLTSTGAGSPPAFEAIPAGVGGATGVDFNDNVKARFGTGNDLEIYHSGSHSHITDAGTGGLKMRGSQVIIDDAAGDVMIQADQDGSIDLYYDGSKKFETETSGTRTTGDHNVTGEIHLTTDNQSLKIGAGADLRIKHNGTDNIIDSVNGDLFFAHSNTNKAALTGGAFRPASNGNIDLGTSSYRWQDVYTSDLDLSNEAKGPNDIDGTWGHYTIVEGESDLFLKNHRNGKKYKFNLTEVS